MAEVLLKHYGGNRFVSFSAGSSPTGEIHPQSISTLKKRGVSASGCRSKSWDEFFGVKGSWGGNISLPEGEFIDQHIDIVITVCDNAARDKTCPIFHGAPVKVHWGVPDPAKFEGTEEEITREFERVCDILEKRVKALIQLPVEKMSKDELQKELDAIGKL